MRAKVHTVYLYFLNECLDLLPKHREDILSAQYKVDRNTPVEDREFFNSEIDTLLIKSIPSEIRQLIILPAIAETFDYDLQNVPGFYFDMKKDYPLNWKINLKGEGLLRPYYRDGRIIGLFIYRDAQDRWPRLLTSFGLPLGTQANQPSEKTERILAA